MAIVHALGLVLAAAGAAERSSLVPDFTGGDASLPRVETRLVEVARGFDQPTDIQAVPGRDRTLALLEKKGLLKIVDLATGTSKVLLRLRVVTRSEMGLLGLAYHPGYERNGRFYVNYCVEASGRMLTRISELEAEGTKERILLEVVQPYGNHKAGQLAFGPDGFLYVGLGDGGWRADPHGNGQNTKTLLGKMLRIDVDKRDPGKPYAIPADNPFASRPSGGLPEVWAWGLRNPWRYSFDPMGRLIVADVGQDLWEEVTIVERATNQGWDAREASHCFEPETGCRTEGLVDPVLEYGRSEGQSITGGYVYTGSSLPALKGKYVFGDFVTGRIWAVDLSKTSAGAAAPPRSALGRFPIQISTFGRDASGEIYAADYGEGTIYKIAPKP